MSLFLVDCRKVRVTSAVEKGSRKVERVEGYQTSEYTFIGGGGGKCLSKCVKSRPTFEVGTVLVTFPVVF